MLHFRILFAVLVLVASVQLSTGRRVRRQAVGITPTDATTAPAGTGTATPYATPAQAGTGTAVPVATSAPTGTGTAVPVAATAPAGNETATPTGVAGTATGAPVDQVIYYNMASPAAAQNTATTTSVTSTNTVNLVYPDPITIAQATADFRQVLGVLLNLDSATTANLPTSDLRTSFLLTLFNGDPSLIAEFPTLYSYLTVPGKPISCQGLVRQ